MALLNIFKKKGKKKEEEKKEEEKKEERKEEPKAPEMRKEVPIAKTPKTPEVRGEIKIAPFVLESPQITEKASFLEGKNQYVFKVFKRATKQEIKKSVEEVYGVRVVKVRTITVPRTQRKLGNTKGWSKGYKKAIVKIKEGQKIEIVPR